MLLVAAALVATAPAHERAGRGSDGASLHDAFGALETTRDDTGGAAAVMHRHRAPWSAQLAAGNLRFQRQRRGQDPGAFGPIGPVCDDLEMYGKGEQRACGLAQLDAPCRVISVGSRFTAKKDQKKAQPRHGEANATGQKGHPVAASTTTTSQWKFEEDVVSRTRCHVDTLDCTVPHGHAVCLPLHLRERVTFHHACIGPTHTYTPGAYRGVSSVTVPRPADAPYYKYPRQPRLPRTATVWDWRTLLQRTGKGRVALLRLDCVGCEHTTRDAMMIHGMTHVHPDGPSTRCEYDVLHSLVANSSGAADGRTADGSDDDLLDDLPDQIAVGVHYTWTHRPKARE